jgi:hypothetical protein
MLNKENMSNNPKEYSSSLRTTGRVSMGSTSNYAQGWRDQNNENAQLSGVFSALSNARVKNKSTSSQKMVTLAACSVIIGVFVGFLSQQADLSRREDQDFARTVVSIDATGHQDTKFDASTKQILKSAEQTFKKINNVLKLHPSVAQVCSGVSPSTALKGDDAVAFSSVQEYTSLVRFRLNTATELVESFTALGSTVSAPLQEHLEDLTAKLNAFDGKCAPSMPSSSIGP